MRASSDQSWSAFVEDGVGEYQLDINCIGSVAANLQKKLADSDLEFTGCKHRLERSERFWGHPVRSILLNIAPESAALWQLLAGSTRRRSLF
jgi:hypothetical protein